MLILKSMKKYPVKFSLFLALLSAAIVPICALYYAGLYALDFLAMLSIFSTLFTVADVVLPLLFLFSVWGFAYLFRAILQSLPTETREKKLLQNTWNLFVFGAVTLTVLSPLYSIVQGSVSLRVLWNFFFGAEWFVGILMGACLARAAFRGRRWLLFFLGITASLSVASDFNGCKYIQPLFDKHTLAEEVGEDVSGGDLLFSLWGLSPAEFDALDDESFADIQEVSFSMFALVAALFAAWIAFHSAMATAFFVLCALYFVGKNDEQNRQDGRCLEDASRIC